MPICKKKNNLVDALRDLGFSPVAIPNDKIQPLIVVEKHGNAYRRTTSVESLFDYDADKNPLPTIQQGVIPSKISKQTTSKIDGEIGLNLLQTWITQLAGVQFSFDVNYHKASTIEIEFLNNSQDETDIHEITKFLEKSSMATTASSYQDKIKNDEIYIITSVLKSNSFSIKVLDGNNNSVDLGAKQEQIGDVSVKIGADKQNQTLITYEGKIPLAFGVQCYQVFYNNGKYSLNPASEAMVKGDVSPVYLKPRSIFLDI